MRVPILGPAPFQVVPVKEMQVEMTENSGDESDSLIPQMKQTRKIDGVGLRLNQKTKYERLSAGHDSDFWKSNNNLEE